MKLLELTLPSPSENLACDEALLDWCEEGASDQVLRVWESSQHFVVVGYANKVAAEVNIAACESRGIPILRRCSGGGAIVQGPGCLNYALVLRISDNGPTRSIRAANRFIMERNRAAMEALLGCPVHIQGHTDLTVNGLKFSGNSQRRRREFLLFHGTILLRFDLGLISELLQMPSRQPDYRNHRTHAAFLTCLDASSQIIKQALSQVWNATDLLSSYPRQQIGVLAASKYASPAGNQNS